VWGEVWDVDDEAVVTAAVAAAVERHEAELEEARRETRIKKEKARHAHDDNEEDEDEDDNKEGEAQSAAANRALLQEVRTRARRKARRQRLAKKLQQHQRGKVRLSGMFLNAVSLSNIFIACTCLLIHMRGFTDHANLACRIVCCSSSPCAYSRKWKHSKPCVTLSSTYRRAR
jgi:hypothetical protein